MNIVKPRFLNRGETKDFGFLPPARIIPKVD